MYSEPPTLKIEEIEVEIWPIARQIQSVIYPVQVTEKNITSGKLLQITTAFPLVPKIIHLHFLKYLIRRKQLLNIIEKKEYC